MSKETRELAETAKETPEELKERLWKEHVNPWRGRAGSTIELKIEQIHQLARIAEALELANERRYGRDIGRVRIHPKNTSLLSSSCDT